MTADGFRVPDEVLAGHASEVDALAARMRAVAAAGRPLDHAAYGLLGQVFALAATDAARAGAVAVGDLARIADDFGNGLRATQESYRSVERDTSALLGGTR